MGNDVAACVSVDAPIDDEQRVEVIARREHKVVMRWLLDDIGNADAIFAMTPVPDCIEVRRRAKTGKRSAPTEVCGDALKVTPFREEDVDASQCRNGEFQAREPAPEPQPTPPGPPVPVQGGCRRGT